MRQVVEEISRNMAYIVSRRGVVIPLPVSLPCSSEKDFDMLCEFAAIEANAENLVSFLLEGPRREMLKSITTLMWNFECD